MTALIARPPLQILSMTSLQSVSRRHSARLQQKEDHVPPSNTTANTSHAITTAVVSKVQPASANTKKRKKTYDEDDDGFLFTRVKSKKPRQSTITRPDPSKPLSSVAESSTETTEPTKTGKARAIQNPQSQHEPQNPDPSKRKRKDRMSFSTPIRNPPQPVRRSKRLSTENPESQGSPEAENLPDLRPPKLRDEKMEKTAKPQPSVQQDAPPQHLVQKEDTVPAPVQPNEAHSSTKIALPFADTPVISRNKAMREGRSSKGERRRSSLGLRGRRASSLIDSGLSNALPHAEVETRDFYKHIEHDLMEPRRMRQLLTWCATRAMHPKPQGSSFEEASAKSAARVIEEELLKDLANKSELSDWFGREDAPASVIPLPERPNPKNLQNADKIVELEEQIKRLRSEKDALEALLRPPSIPNPPPFTTDNPSLTHQDTLSPADAAILESCRSNSIVPAHLSSRVDKVIQDLEPAIDVFADGIHKINQYKITADRIASEILSTCAAKLAEREALGKRKALGTEEDRSPGRDLTGVLRGLSRADR